MVIKVFKKPRLNFDFKLFLALFSYLRDIILTSTQPYTGLLRQNQSYLFVLVLTLQNLRNIIRVQNNNQVFKFLRAFF
jgi:hypothetical protein